MGMDKYKYPKLHDKEWLEEAIKTNTVRDIANSVGCSYSAVQYALVKHEIRIPKRLKYNVTVDKSKIAKKAYRQKWPNGRYGKLASNWRGGRRKMNGYVFVYAPDHPRASTNNAVQEHILIMEKHLGRYLEDDEVVHHKNGVKDDNRLENLEVVHRGDHVSNHFKASHEVLEQRDHIKSLESRIRQLEKELKQCRDST